jgi:hypothetical protein
VVQNTGLKPFYARGFILKLVKNTRENWFCPARYLLGIIEECHDSEDGGHRGVKKTLARIRQRFWWKGIASSVKSYVKSCHFCQTFNSLVGLPVGKFRPVSPPREMFHTLGIDYLGPFKTTIRGNQYLIVCIDYLSRWMEARPVASTGIDYF